MAPFKTTKMNAIWKEAARRNTTKMNRTAQTATNLTTPPASPRQEDADSAVQILNRKVARLNDERKKLLSENRRYCKQMAALSAEKAQFRSRAMELDDLVASSKNQLAVSSDKLATSEHRFNVMKRRRNNEKDTATMLELQRIRRIKELEKQVARAEDVAIRRRREVDVGNLREQIEEHIANSGGPLSECTQENRTVLVLFSQLVKEQYKRENLEDELFTAQDHLKNYQWREVAAGTSFASESKLFKQENLENKPQSTA